MGHVSKQPIKLTCTHAKRRAAPGFLAPLRLALPRVALFHGPTSLRLARLVSPRPPRPATPRPTPCSCSCVCVCGCVRAHVRVHACAHLCALCGCARRSADLPDAHAVYFCGALLSCLFLATLASGRTSLLKLASLLAVQLRNTAGELLTQAPDVEGTVDLCNNVLQTPGELLAGLTPRLPRQCLPLLVPNPGDRRFVQEAV